MINKEFVFYLSGRYDKVDDLILNYFIQHGFKLIKRDSNAFFFEKGSLLRNHVTFNPLAWKSQIRITQDCKTIKVKAAVDTTGQKVLSSEIDAWNCFFKQFIQTLQQRKQLTKPNTKYSWFVYIEQFKYISRVIVSLVAITLFLVLGAGIIHWLRN